MDIKDNENQNLIEIEQAFSDDEDIELQNKKNGPWQCGLSNLSERVLALYKNGNFTDITLTFPGTDMTYEAHRLILAISSPVFESLLYGPMRTEGRNVLLYDDDPLMMAYVIAHCYGNDLQLPDIDTDLEVYKLADKYLLDSLKQDCCQHIANHICTDNNNAVVEFTERFNFTDLKSNCLSLIKEKFKRELNSYMYDFPFEKNASAFGMLMGLSNSWIELLLSEVCVKVLDFRESWKYPESLVEDNSLRAILSNRRCYLDRFYGCINAECIQQFPLAPIPVNTACNNKLDPCMGSNGPRYINNTVEALELYLSVTDPHHAKRVIEAINEQNRFENNLIALHIRCEEVWPSNWSPIQPERTHRPSVLLISDADDDKTSWVVEAAKALLPQSEGSYTKVFRKCYNNAIQLKPVNILYLPRSNLTPHGFIRMLQELSFSGVKCNKIFFESPNICSALTESIQNSLIMLVHGEFNPTLLRREVFDDMFRNLFEAFPQQ